MSTPEFSRPEWLDTIGEVARTVTISADSDERAALARRFALLAIDTLAGSFEVRREPGGVRVTGSVTAALVQPCAITGEPIPAKIAEQVDLRFVPSVGVTGGDDELELSEGDLDTVEFDGSAIDLGETAAETMALALDPFPRSAAAAEALRDAGVLSEEEARPAGGLAGLKALLEKDAG